MTFLASLKFHRNRHLRLELKSVLVGYDIKRTSTPPLSLYGYRDRGL